MGVEWQSRHALGEARMGRARKRVRPNGVSRSPWKTFRSGWFLNSLITSSSQSTDRSRGFVGLGEASL